MRTTSDRGSVTAETAVLLPVLLVVLALCLSVLTAVAAQLKCVDAARAAARAAARGDAVPVVQEVGRARAPEGASVRVVVGDDTVEVAVRARVRPFGRALRVLPPVQVSARASAPRER